MPAKGRSNLRYAIVRNSSGNTALRLFLVPSLCDNPSISDNELATFLSPDL